ncbi:hypothetical protein [Cohnella sp. GbtcB17]|uniref:hypothetical protein n=1 Tax=Cohnella sp. GbtcB17 TaxID=2824762 RepID=UPI001C310708|nr:hypothetical protein [Cohnella sp. GbtcB17]
MGQGIIRDRGFEDLSQGTFGNAGHNLYVSRHAARQRSSADLQMIEPPFLSGGKAALLKM